MHRYDIMYVVTIILFATLLFMALMELINVL